MMLARWDPGHLHELHRTKSRPRMRHWITLVTMLNAAAIMAQFSWTPCTMPTTPLQVMAMGHSGELVTLLNTSPTQVMVSSDQGLSWQSHPGINGPSALWWSTALLHVTKSGGILIWGKSGSSGIRQVWRSADGGDTFVSIGAGQGIPPNSVFYGFVSGPNDDVYLYGHGVLRSTDAGLNWTTIVPPTTVLHAFTAIDGHVFGAEFFTIYRGGVDGSGFAPIPTGIYNVSPATDMARTWNERVIAAGWNFKIITSADDGATWAQASTGIPGGTVEHVAGTLFNDTWASTYQNEVFATSDAGASWSLATSGTSIPASDPIKNVFCDSTGTFYIYGDSYIYRSDISTAITPAGEVATPLIHPNPTSGTVWLDPIFAGRHCRVLDITGRTVCNERVDTNGSLELGAIETGRYVLMLDDSTARIDLVIEH